MINDERSINDDIFKESSLSPDEFFSSLGMEDSKPKPTKKKVEVEVEGTKKDEATRSMEAIDLAILESIADTDNPNVNEGHVMDGDAEDEEEEEKVEKKKPAKKATPVANASTAKKAETEDRSSIIYGFLKQTGVFDEDLPDGENIDEDRVIDMLEESINKQVDIGIEETIKDLPPFVKDLVKYAKNGGSPEEFLKTFIKGRSDSITEGLDMTQEKNQELMVREKMRSDNIDDDTIDDTIESYKERGRLENIANGYYNSWINNTKREKEELMRDQERRVEEYKQRLRRDKEELSGVIKSVPGLSLSKEMEKNLPSYIYDNSVRLEGGSVISKFQQDIFVDIYKNKKALAQLATLMQTRNADGTFNFSKIKSQGGGEQKDRVEKKIVFKNKGFDSFFG